MTKKESWKDYYKVVSKRPPHPVLRIALSSFSLEKGIACDLGAGAGADAKYLANKGWKVFAIDKEDASIKFLNEIKTKDGEINATKGDFEKIKLKKSKLIYSFASLPFCNPKAFNRIWSEIYSSLEKEGVFVGTIFGNNDTWAKVHDSKMTFLNHQQFLKKLNGYDVIFFDEQEEDRPTALGHKKHWHIYSFILKKL